MIILQAKYIYIIGPFFQKRRLKRITNKIKERGTGKKFLSTNNVNASSFLFIFQFSFQINLDFALIKALIKTIVKEERLKKLGTETNSFLYGTFPFQNALHNTLCIKTLSRGSFAKYIILCGTIICSQLSFCNENAQWLSFY